MKNKTTAKQTVEQLIESGELVLIDPFLTRKAGLGSKVALPKAEHTALEIDRRMGLKKGKEIKVLLNAIAWTVLKCQKTGVKANALVHVPAAGFPALVMCVYPFNLTDSRESVLIIQRMKSEEK